MSVYLRPRTATNLDGFAFDSSLSILSTRLHRPITSMAEALASPPSIEEELAACLLPYEVIISRSSIWRDKSTVRLSGTPTGVVDTDRQLVQALELLALLTHLDWSLWKRVIDKVGGSIGYNCKQLGDIRSLNVVLCLGRASMWSEDLCEFLVHSSTNTVSSPEFVASKTLLLRVLAEQGRAVGEVFVRIPGEHRLTTVQFTKTSQLVSRQHLVCQEAQQAAEGRDIISTKRFYCGLRFRLFEMGDIERHQDDTMLRCAAEIASCGVSLTYLSPSRIQVQEQHPREFMDAMTKLFPPSTHEPRGGVSCVAVREFFPTRSHPAFFSAVAASSSVRTVNVSPHFDECVSTKQKRWFWSWFAYGAFRKARREAAAVEKVSIHTQGLDQDAVDAIAHVLRAPNPVSSLFDDEGAMNAPEYVSASQFTLLDPSISSDTSPLSKWICDHPVENLPVIKRTDDWVSVLLPRWGQAWIHHDDVLSSQSTASVPLEIKWIPHVTLEVVDETQLDPVVALLHVIGRGIRHLTVSAGYFYNRSLHFDWESLARGILKACPGLESLELEGNTIKLKTLHRIVAALSSGSCRLQRLHIQCRNLTGGCRSLPPLIEALSNRQNPASRYLKEIKLGSMPFSTMLKPSAVPACIAMLKENTVLEQLHLGFRVQPLHRAQFMDFVTQLRPFDNERIDGGRDPHAKLAFLSVVAAERPHDESTRAIQQLDAHVLSAIFAFAASSFLRQVTVRS